MQHNTPFSSVSKWRKPVASSPPPRPLLLPGFQFSKWDCGRRTLDDTTLPDLRRNSPLPVSLIHSFPIDLYSNTMLFFFLQNFDIFSPLISKFWYPNTRRYVLINTMQFFYMIGEENNSVRVQSAPNQFCRRFNTPLLDGCLVMN
jgi:hypothetical protein